MNEQTTTTDKAIEKKTDEEPSPGVTELLRTIDDKSRRSMERPIKKETTPRKRAPRATRAKSTSKRGKPTKKTNSKAKETKARATKPKPAKETKPKTTKTKAVKGETTKETKKGALKPSTPTLSQMDMRHQLVLYTMRRMNREATYEELGNETGFSRAVLRRVINAQIGNDSLVSRELVAVNQYETEEGEFSSPYYFQLTDTGKKLVK